MVRLSSTSRNLPQQQQQQPEHQYGAQQQQYDNDGFGASNFDNNDDDVNNVTRTHNLNNVTTNDNVHTTTTLAPTPATNTATNTHPNILRQPALTTSIAGETLDQLCSSKSAFAKFLKKSGAFQLLQNSIRGMPPGSRVSTARKNTAGTKVQKIASLLSFLLGRP